MRNRFRDVYTDPLGTEIHRTSEHTFRPRRRSATRAGVAGLLIAGAFLFGCKGEPRPDSDQGLRPAPEARETPVASIPDESAERVSAPEPESKAPSSAGPTSPEPPEDAASPRHDDEADADEGASPAASRPPAQPDAAADDPTTEVEETADEPPTLDEVLVRHGDELKAIRGVVAVAGAECSGAPCILVTVTRRTQKLLSQLPQSLEGYPVSVVEHQGGH